MISTRSWVLFTLRRVGQVLADDLVVAQVQELIAHLRDPPPAPKRRPKVEEVLEGLGRPLPPPPKAKPLLSKLSGRAHLRPTLAGTATGKNPLDDHRTPPDPIGAQTAQASGARSLLLEIIRRAAFDWVLYRSSRRIDQKLLAEDAYTWIFLENEHHPHWKIRVAEGKQLTSFICICEQLDVDAERLRGYIRNLTPSRAMSSGRPPENSRPGESTMDVHIHADVVDQGGAYDFDSLLMPFDLD